MRNILIYLIKFILPLFILAEVHLVDAAQFQGEKLPTQSMATASGKTEPTQKYREKHVNVPTDRVIQSIRSQLVSLNRFLIESPDIKYTPSLNELIIDVTDNLWLLDNDVSPQSLLLLLEARSMKSFTSYVSVSEDISCLLRRRGQAFVNEAQVFQRADHESPCLNLLKSELYNKFDGESVHAARYCMDTKEFQHVLLDILQDVKSGDRCDSH